jgi:hypothetical protein
VPALALASTAPSLLFAQQALAFGNDINPEVRIALPRALRSRSGGLQPRSKCVQRQAHFLQLHTALHGLRAPALPLRGDAILLCASSAC